MSISLYPIKFIFFALFNILFFSFTPLGATEVDSVLERFIGEFTVAHTVKDKDNKTMEVYSHVKGVLMPGQRYIHTTFTTTIPNDETHPVTRIGTLTFNKQANVYQSSWIGGCIEGIDFFEGYAGNDELTLYSYSKNNKDQWTKRYQVYFQDNGNFNVISTKKTGENSLYSVETLKFKRVSQ